MTALLTQPCPTPLQHIGLSDFCAVLEDQKTAAHFYCLFSNSTFLLSFFWEHSSVVCFLTTPLLLPVFWQHTSIACFLPISVAFFLRTHFCCLFSDSTLLLSVFWKHTFVVCFRTTHSCCLFSDNTLLLSVFVLHTLVVCFLTTHLCCLFADSYVSHVVKWMWERTQVREWLKTSQKTLCI